MVEKIEKVKEYLISKDILAVIDINMFTDEQLRDMYEKAINSGEY